MSVDSTSSQEASVGQPSYKPFDSTASANNTYHGRPRRHGQSRKKIAALYIGGLGECAGGLCGTAGIQPVRLYGIRK